MRRLIHIPKTKRRRAALCWLAVAVWAALIFYLSSVPSLNTGLGLWDTVLRKLAHMAEFGLLNTLIWLALRQHSLSGFHSLPAAVALSLLYAVSDEFHQRFVPGRTASIRDVGFDFAGVIIAAIAITIARKRSSSSP